MKSREARKREAWMIIGGMGGTVAILLVLLGVVEASVSGLSSEGLLQATILSLTAIIVFWYAKETQRLREAAQQQIEAQQRPFVIVTPETPKGDLERLKIQNIGNSAAINIRIVLDGEPTILPILVKDESVAGPVLPIDHDRITQGLAAAQRRYREEKKYPENLYGLRFHLRDTSITDGFQFTVEYKNVAMESYETVEKLWPHGFEIIHSGKRLPLNS